MYSRCKLDSGNRPYIYDVSISMIRIALQRSVRDDLYVGLSSGQSVPGVDARTAVGDHIAAQIWNDEQLPESESVKQYMENDRRRRA